MIGLLVLFASTSFVFQQSGALDQNHHHHHSQRSSFRSPDGKWEGKITRHGVFVFPGWEGDLVSKSFKTYGEYSEAEIRVFTAILRSGDVVLEVGANIGALTIPIAKIVGPQGHVHAFEPANLTIQYLRANIALNCLNDVVAAQHAAVSDMSQGKFGTLITLDDNTGGAFLLSEASSSVQRISMAASHEMPTGQVTSTKFASPVRASEVTKIVQLDEADLPHRIDLIKIDTEGHELRVLRGASKLITATRPMIYAEMGIEAHRVAQYFDSICHHQPQPPHTASSSVQPAIPVRSPQSAADCGGGTFALLDGLAFAAMADAANLAVLRHLGCTLSMRLYWVVAPLYPGPSGGFAGHGGNVFVQESGDVMLPAFNVLAVPPERLAADRRLYNALAGGNEVPRASLKC